MDTVSFLIHSRKRRLRRNCAVTIYHSRQRVAFACYSVYATPHDNAAVPASAGTVPATPAGSGDAAVIAIAITK